MVHLFFFAAGGASRGPAGGRQQSEGEGSGGPHPHDALREVSRKLFLILNLLISYYYCLPEDLHLMMYFVRLPGNTYCDWLFLIGSYLVESIR